MKKAPIIETITFDDGTTESFSLYRWAKEYGLSVRLVYSRYYAGVRGQNLLSPTNRDTLSEDLLHRLWGGTWQFTGVFSQKTNARISANCS